MLVTASWVVLYQAVFGRMYALFLLTSALSYLALLSRWSSGGRRRWVLWGIAVLATLASHPYGVLVLASQGLFVLLLRQRLREAIWAFAAVLVAGTPFWVADLVLSRRFDVGVGGGGAKLGAPGPVARYLRFVAGDFLTSNQLLPRDPARLRPRRPALLRPDAAADGAARRLGRRRADGRAARRPGSATRRRPSRGT